MQNTFGVHFEIYDNASTAARNLNTFFDGVTSQMLKLEMQARQAQKVMAFGGELQRIGLGIIAPLGEAINVTMDFEAQMSKVGAISRATTTEMEQLTKASMDLGASTAFSAKQVAEGQEFLAMAGFSVRDNLAAMPGLLNLAAASGIQLGKAADIASNTLTAFGLSADESNRVADVMALTTASANTNMLQLAEAMKPIASLSNNLGVSLEETSAMIGLLADQGIQGSAATRTFTTGVKRLADATPKMRKEMEAMGLDFFDAEGRFIGLTDSVGQFEKAISNGDLTDERALQMMSIVMGKQASTTMMSLLNATKQIDLTKMAPKELQEFRDTFGDDRINKALADTGLLVLKGSEALEGYTKTLENAGGTAEKMSKQMLDNLKGDITIFRSAYEGFMLRLGGIFTPVLRQITQIATKTMEVFNRLMESRFAPYVASTIAVIGGLIAAFGTLIAMRAGVSYFFTMLRMAGMASVSALAPILPYVAAIGALAAAAYLAYYSFQRFNAVLEGSEQISTGLVGVMQKLGGFVSGIISIFQTWDAKEQSFQFSPEQFDLFAKLGIQEDIIAIGTWIGRGIEFFRAFGGALQEVFNEVYGVLKSLYPIIVDALNQIFESLGMSKIEKGIGGLESWQSAGRMVGKVIGYILASGFTIFLLQTASFLVVVGAQIYQTVVFLKGLYAAFTDLKGTMAVVERLFWNTIASIKTGLFNFFLWTLQNTPAFLMKAFLLAIDGVYFMYVTLPQMLITTTLGFLGWVLYNIPDFFYRTFMQVNSQGTTIFQNFIQGVQDRFWAMVSGFSEIGTAIVNALIQGLGAAWGELTAYLGNKFGELPGADLIFGDTLNTRATVPSGGRGGSLGLSAIPNLLAEQKTLTSPQTNVNVQPTPVQNNIQQAPVVITLDGQVLAKSVTENQKKQDKRQ